MQTEKSTLNDNDDDLYICEILDHFWDLWQSLPYWRGDKLIGGKWQQNFAFNEESSDITGNQELIFTKLKKNGQNKQYMRLYSAADMEDNCLMYFKKKTMV